MNQERDYTIGQDATFCLGRSRYYYFAVGANALASGIAVAGSSLRAELVLLAGAIVAALFGWSLAESRCAVTAFRYRASGQWCLQFDGSVLSGSADTRSGWRPVSALYIRRVTPLTLQLVVVEDGDNRGQLSKFASLSGSKRYTKITLWRDQLPASDLRLLRVLLSLA